jgi:hypothetical protein
MSGKRELVLPVDRYRYPFVGKNCRAGVARVSYPGPVTPNCRVERIAVRIIQPEKLADLVNLQRDVPTIGRVDHLRYR